ncbi:hypothetical protein [Oceanobacillus jeddahense]|uniref:hypothetical protein n=1 Tax=Oceanobacillus jeddahense TaxID=1462527 RepID=UPI0011DD2A43|nr:hypothetical protein [Oceanobacillus jeddahense]
MQKQIMVFGGVFPLEKKRYFIGFDVLHKDEGSLVKVSLLFFLSWNKSAERLFKNVEIGAAQLR